MRALKPQQKTKKEQRRQKRYRILSLSLFITLIVFLLWFLNQKSLQVSKVFIQGNQNVTRDDIQQVIQLYLQKKILWVIPQNNIFILSLRSLEHNIENTFPEIYNTKISLKNKTSLIVHVEERKPYSLWCKNDIYFSPFDEECYFTDQRGFIYMKAPYFSDGVFEKIYTDATLLKIGEQVMDENDFKDFFNFTHFLSEQHKISIARIVMTQDKDVLLYIKNIGHISFQKDTYPFLIYHYGTPYSLLMRNIDLLMNHKLFKNDLAQKKDRLKFIDLRIRDQLRYKFYLDDEWNRLQEDLHKQQEQEYEHREEQE